MSSERRNTFTGVSRSSGIGLGVNRASTTGLGGGKKQIQFSGAEPETYSSSFRRYSQQQRQQPANLDFERDEKAGMDPSETDRLKRDEQYMDDNEEFENIESLINNDSGLAHGDSGIGSGII